MSILKTVNFYFSYFKAFINQGHQMILLLACLGLCLIFSVLFWLFPDQLIFCTLYPREPFGLLGIFTGPFIHGGISHLLLNSLSFLLMGGAVSSVFGKRFPMFLLQVYLLNGIVLWCVGRASFHLGLSGVVLSLLGALLVSSVLVKKGSMPAFFLVVGIFYIDVLKDGMVAGSGIAWDGHVVGLTIGLIWGKLFLMRT